MVKYILFSAGRPCECTSTEKVKVQMPNGLSPVFPGIGDETESVTIDAKAAGKLRNNICKNMGRESSIFRAKVQNAADMLLRYDEYMLRCLRI